MGSGVLCTREWIVDLQGLDGSWLSDAHYGSLCSQSAAVLQCGRQGQCSCSTHQTLDDWCRARDASSAVAFHSALNSAPWGYIDAHGTLSSAADRSRTY